MAIACHQYNYTNSLYRFSFVFVAPFASNFKPYRIYNLDFVRQSKNYSPFLVITRTLRSSNQSTIIEHFYFIFLITFFISNSFEKFLPDLKNKIKKPSESVSLEFKFNQNL